MSRARELSRLGNINVLSGDDINSEVGIASTVPRSTLDVRGELQVGTGIQVGPAGVITATSFDGALGGNIVAAACTFTTGTFTGNVTIGGTLTYEDVTNVDALGIVTARAGVNVSGGQLLVGSGVTIGNAGVATFSGTSDVHLLDSVKLNLGDGSDLSIYHNGSNGYSYIEDTGSGRLVVKTSYFEIDNEAGNEAILEGIADGAVKAYYNGSLKLETTSGGIQVTGNDGVTIVGAQDNSADLFFNADGGDDNDDKWYLGAYAGGPFKLLNYASGSWETNIEANGNGNVELYFNNSKKFETNNDGTVTTGVSTATGGLRINADGSASASHLALGASLDDLVMWHQNGNSYLVNNDGNLTLRSDGHVYIQDTSGNTLADFNEDGPVELYHNANKKFETTNDGTVTTGISTATGGLAINADSKKLTLGADADFDIYHSGSTNFITATTHNIHIDLQSGTENSAKFIQNGAVELYHNGTKTFETTSVGAAITSLAHDGGLTVGAGSNNQSTALDLKAKSSGGTEYTGRISVARGNGAISMSDGSSTYIAMDAIGVRLSGIVTASAGVAYTGLLRESFAKTDGRLSANTNIDLEDGMVHYFTTTENTTSTPNIRWNSSFSLNNKMNINDAITVTIISAAAAAGYSAQLTIDGSAVTEQWVGGDAPSEGGSDGYDIYTYNILKTADATFFVIGNLVNAT